MEPMNLTINALPAFTYRWLHMNEATVEGAKAAHEVLPFEQIPPMITRKHRDASRLAPLASGSGRDLDALIEASGTGTTHYAIAAGESTGKDALRLLYVLGDETEEGATSSVALELAENSKMTVVMDFTSPEKTEGFAGIQLKAELKEGAVLNLIQLIRVGNEFSLINDIGGHCEKNAEVNVYHLFLGGKRVWQGCRFHLDGEGSRMTADTGYVLDGDRTLDMNYVADQTGRKTVSVMNAAGVLRDQAKKLYRGTIDFKNGCSGSTGDEKEDVLMMSDEAVNQSIPLILCAEEDVVGNHGATIGQLPEDVLFYAESRGMTTESIYEMMSRARIDAIVRRIPDVKTRHQLFVALGEEVE